jgi:DNA-directed RNA polymerase specialized sigma subunit
MYVERKLNKFYTPQEYKDMSIEKIIELYSNLIEKLTSKYSIDRRFTEDIRNDVILELIKRHNSYDVSKNTHFSAYIYPYLLNAAATSHQMNYGCVYIHYSSSKLLQKNNKAININPCEIDEKLQGFSCDKTSEELFKNTYINSDSELLSIYKIVIKAINSSQRSEVKKQNIKDAIRRCLKENNFKYIGHYSKFLKEILKDTVLARKFNK